MPLSVLPSMPPRRVFNIFNLLAAVTLAPLARCESPICTTPDAVKPTPSREIPTRSLTPTDTRLPRNQTNRHTPTCSLLIISVLLARITDGHLGIRTLVSTRRTTLPDLAG
ncbi:hypothetical protein GGS23DRAFT_554336 [Durotheca rogersii]|uniref:uncharacterized protein n=1 Tax=Durotheca rogersii TaxID=419775 RepID=UPI0022209D41|nr:uncharacterized protein GGS23DRAFT_554336 [Durotheca rogersii]KAI5865853.1 hypothetical protein GGS23DRAFT_554336 [Durotheca rogersii]